MFVNQVDGNGNFKVTDINSDNINATNATFTNLNTTTFSPTNFNATTAVATNLTATNGDIATLTNTTITSSGLATSGSINTGTISASGQINTTAGIIASGTISGSTLNSTGNGIITGNLVVPHVIIPSNNNLSSNAELIKLQDELRINGGATDGTIGFYQGTTRQMELDSNGNVVIGGSVSSSSANIPIINTFDFTVENSGFMKFYNTTGKYMAISHQPGGFVDFYASRNNPATPNSFRFYSGDGLSNDLKMTIHGNSNVVEVGTIHAHTNIRTDELLLKDTTSVNTSRIIREQNTIKFMGDTLYSSCDFEFYTSDPAVRDPIPKLKINRTSDLVEIPELGSTHITGTTIDATDVITTNVSAQNSTALNSTVTNLLLRDSTNDFSKIERTGNIVKFLGDTTSTGNADFEFHTTDGNQPGQNVPKLKILRNNDLVEVINLEALDTIEATTLIADQVSTTDADFTNITTGDITVNDELDFGANNSKIWSGNASFHFQSGAVLNGKDFKFQTGNVPAEVVYFRSGRGKGFIETDEGQLTDLTITDHLYIQNQSGRQLSIEHVDDNIYFYGSKNSNSVPSNFNFMTNAGANPSDIKLKINKSTNFVDVIDMNVSNELIVNGTNIETEIATKQDTLIAGTGITITGNTISSTGGGGGNLTAGDNIDITNNVVSTTANVEFTNSTTTGVLYVKDSTNVHEVLEYWNPAQSQFFKRSFVYDDYDMFDMLIFNNDATPANRSINVDCDMTVTGDLVVNGTNIETQISSKQDTLSAGAGITIDANNEISYSGATPVTYTEGLNISINAQDEIETVIDPVFDQVDAGSTSIGGLTNAATFHHVSLPGFADHALTQYATGVTILNAKAGQQLSFRQGQSQKAKLDNAGDFHIMRQGTLSNLPTELDQIQGDLVTKQVNLTAGANIALDSLGNISSTDTTYTAGTNVTIDAGNVISSTDTTYTAGTNVTIDAGNVISSTDTTYTAGDNIAITGNVISSSSPLARISYYRLGGFTTIPNSTIRDYFQNSFTTEYNNLSIPFTAQSSGNASSGWFLAQGVYKIEYKACFDNGQYNDRLGTRVRFYFDGAYHFGADAHGYARASSFIDRQTVNSNFIYEVPSGGQYMRIFHNCARNSITYNDIWDSNALIFGMTLCINKLD